MINMYGVVIKKIVLIGGLVSALACFSWHILCDREILYAAFVSLCVMFVVSSILNIGLQGIARILIKFLREQQNQVDSEDESRRITSNNPDDR